MQGGTRPGENPESERLSTPLQDLSAALTRGDAAFKMFRDFSVCGLRELAGASLQGLMNSRSLTAMDLYDRPIGDVMRELESRGVQVERQTANKACSHENFRNTAWTMKRGDSVLLLTDVEGRNALVVGIQKQQNRVNPNQ
jgi:hypothetical protein